MEAKKVLIVAVNYNSYDALESYLGTIRESLISCLNKIEVTVIVADNSTDYKAIDVNKWNDLSLDAYKLDNLGYLGGQFCHRKN